MKTKHEARSGAAGSEQVPGVRVYHLRKQISLGALARSSSDARGDRGVEKREIEPASRTEPSAKVWRTRRALRVLPFAKLCFPLNLAPCPRFDRRRRRSKRRMNEMGRAIVGSAKFGRSHRLKITHPRSRTSLSLSLRTLPETFLTMRSSHAECYISLLPRSRQRQFSLSCNRARDLDGESANIHSVRIARDQTSRLALLSARPNVRATCASPGRRAKVARVRHTLPLVSGVCLCACIRARACARIRISSRKSLGEFVANCPARDAARRDTSPPAYCFAKHVRPAAHKQIVLPISRSWCNDNN